MFITVTGSTGTIGSALVGLLADAHVPVRAVARDVTALRPLPGVVPVQADLTDETLLEPVLAGTTRLFLLTGNAAGFANLQIGVIRAARDLGVQHVVKLSALGASGHSRSWIGSGHYDVERELIASGIPWTILRPHSFMQNWLDDVAESVRAEGVIRAPIGDGRVPFIDTRDIAEVAARVLLDPATHAGAKYVLTSGAAVGYADVAEALSELLGRPVRYEPISPDEARERMSARGLSDGAIDALLAIAAYQRAGGPTSKVSDDVERILGRPPRTIRDFARDHARHFGG
ncbi:MAG TPA: SDR family oxidoreductase [Longimicrobiales bacterium]